MPQEQYSLRCAVTSEAQHDILHIQVKCKIYQPECYYKHLTFKQLPSILQSVFNNISHLFVHINRPDMVYFDNLDSSIKICILIAGQIREVPIKMQARNRIEGIIHRIGLVQQQKAKNMDQFNRVKEEKQGQLDQIKKVISQQNEERQQLQKQLQELAANKMSVQSQICQLNLQIEYKMNQLEKMNQTYQEYNNRYGSASQSANLTQNAKNQALYSSNVTLEDQRISIKYSDFDKTHPQNSVKVIVDTTLQKKKQFWISEITKIKKSKAMPLKQLIRPQSKFQEQTVVSIRGIQLKNMLFVQIFQNLQTIDLSNNHIRRIEGLTELKRLKQLDLSLNMIEVIKGLANNIFLDELILHSNRIRVLQNIFHLKNLRILSLSQNQIAIIPDRIGRMAGLVQLKLGNNFIIDVSQKVLNLSKLRVFTIVGNKCYSDNNKSKKTIDQLISKGIRTTE